MQWSKEECLQRIQREEQDVRAIFRMGLLEINNHQY